MTNKQIEKYIINEKVTNVEWENNKIKFDDISRANFNTLIRQLESTSKQKNVELDFYTQFLKDTKKELLNSVKKANKYIGTEYENQMLDMVKDASNKLKYHMDYAKEFIPKRYSKDFQEEPLTKLKITQANIYDLNDMVTSLYTDATGFTREHVEKALEVHSPEETSYYDKLMYLQGYLPDNPDEPLDDRYKKYIYEDENHQNVIMLNGNKTECMSREKAMEILDRERYEKGFIGATDLENQIIDTYGYDAFKEIRKKEEFISEIRFLKMWG